MVLLMLVCSILGGERGERGRGGRETTRDEKRKGETTQSNGSSIIQENELFLDFLLTERKCMYTLGTTVHFDETRSEVQSIERMAQKLNLKSHVVHSSGTRLSFPVDSGM